MSLPGDSRSSDFHVVTVGWAPALDGLLGYIASGAAQRFTNIVHPAYLAADLPPRNEYVFLRREAERLPEADTALLASLEQPGVPTLHNMIWSDRIVSTVDYNDALRWATFLAHRFRKLYEELRPSVVIGAFDGIHSSISLAVARRMKIPWYAMNFSVLPPDFACLCDGMSPALRVQIHVPDERKLRALATDALTKFEQRSVQARAYITPPALSVAQLLRKVPARLRSVQRTLAKSRQREALQFTHERTDFSIRAALSHLRSVRRARAALARERLITTPPSKPYILFGLHTQPESSIDVWAPFVSNQLWVLEWMARSIPPSHKLLVKIHKSDAAKYSAEQLRQMRSMPGVELVHPFSDGRRFVESADLLVAIQGTMALEAALMGKPVILLADSPTTLFPSAARSGVIDDLPGLVLAKLREPRPDRERIIDGLAEYLRPFLPASYNDWNAKLTDGELRNYSELFSQLELYLAREPQLARSNA